MAQKLITGPVAEPITREDVYLQCKVDTSTEDALLDIYIAAARKQVEQRLGRKLMLQTWELALDEFPENAIKLPFIPVVQVLSIKYINTDGDEVLIDGVSYALDDYGIEHFILLALDTDWPEVMAVENAIKIRFVVGYEDAASVPENIKLWMLLAIGSWYKNRESVVTGTIANQLPRDFGAALLDEAWVPVV